MIPWYKGVFTEKSVRVLRSYSTKKLKINKYILLVHKTIRKKLKNICKHPNYLSTA